MRANSGEFVFIECGELAVLGRIIEIALPSTDQIVC